MMVVAYLIVVTYPEGFDPASGVWTFGTRFSLRPGGTRDSSPAIYRRATVICASGTRSELSPIAQ